MKTPKVTVLALAVVLFAAAGLNAQQTIPSFKGVAICVMLNGKLAIDTKAALVKMGADPAQFVDKNGGCALAPKPYLRIGVSAPAKSQASSETSSASGNLPGYSSGGSYSRSGNWVAVDAVATLVLANGEYQRIGFHSNAFQAGNVSSSNSVSGSTSRGGYSSGGGFSRTTPEDEAAGMATRHALHDLLHNRKSWTPGADKIVTAAFTARPTPVPVAATTTTAPAPQTDAEKIRAEAAALREQTQALREKTRAEADARKSAAAAEKEKAKAQKELDKAKAEADKKKK